MAAVTGCSVALRIGRGARVHPDCRGERPAALAAEPARNADTRRLSVSGPEPGAIGGMTCAVRNSFPGNASAVSSAASLRVHSLGGVHSGPIDRRGPHPGMPSWYSLPGDRRFWGCNTGRVSRTDRQTRRLSTAARWALLVAVLVGLFGMHVLTAEDDSGGHGGLPMIGTSGHPDMTVTAHSPADPMPVVMDAVGTLPRVAAEVSADPGAGGVDHGAMAGCILFLAVGGAVLILLLVRLRDGQKTTELGGFASNAVSDMRRRGPPGRWPRLALCVIRV